METAIPGSSSWMPYVPQGVEGFDDGDGYGMTNMQICVAECKERQK